MKWLIIWLIMLFFAGFMVGAIYWEEKGYHEGVNYVFNEIYAK